MRKLFCLFTIIFYMTLLPAAVLAAPAQKYSLVTGGGKVTAYLVQDEIYVRPEETANAVKGTNFAFDASFVDDAYKITLKTDFSGDLQKLKCKSNYDDVPAAQVGFTVEGYDAWGTLNGIDIEGVVFKA